MIIDAKSLKQCLHDDTVLLFDVRSHAHYLEGHIPGAIHFDAEQANSSKGPIKGLLPDLKTFEGYINSKGLSAGKTVIVYDQQGGPSSGRVAWTLLSLGHPNVSILNGGIDAWLSEGFANEQTEPCRRTGNFIATRIEDYIADQTLILKKLHDTNTILLDVRSPDEYHGADIRSARGGHIPGAINMNWTDSKDTTNNKTLFKAPPILKKNLLQLGLMPDKEIIVYCQSHQRSALIWVLLKALGYTKVRGYPGAWSDWGNSADTPIEK